jgi:hypothetical protein
MRLLPAALILLFSSAILGACAPGDEESGSRGCALRAACDVLQPACQRAVFAATACMREQTDAVMPAVRTISLAQLREELEQARAERDENDDGEPWRRSLSLFGLVARDRSYEEAQIDEQVSFYGAYYSSNTQRVTLISDYLRADRRFAQTLLLSHEFVHALQDQREGIAALWEEHRDSSDAGDSLSALIEGEARTLSLVLMAPLVGAQPHELTWQAAFDAELARQLDTVNADDSPLFSAWRLVYPIGTYAVSNAYLSAGLDGIAALYRAPPRTMLAWTLPESEREAPAELSCSSPEPPAGYALSEVERHGMLGLLALYAGAGLGAVYHEAQAWSADAYAVFRAQEDDSSEVAVAWRIRFQHRSDADAFRAAFADAFELRQHDDEIVLAAASSPELLQEWAFDTCPASDVTRD